MFTNWLEIELNSNVSAFTHTFIHIYKEFCIYKKKMQFKRLCVDSKLYLCVVLFMLHICELYSISVWGLVMPSRGGLITRSSSECISKGVILRWPG